MDKTLSIIPQYVDIIARPEIIGPEILEKKNHPFPSKKTQTRDPVS